MTLKSLAKITTMIAGIGIFAASSYTILASTSNTAWAETSLAQQVADGKPWAMQPQGGPKAEMTLFPDGTGTTRGLPFPLKPTWRETPGGICITMGFLGEKCATLAKIKNGFEGTNGGKREFQLTR